MDIGCMPLQTETYTTGALSSHVVRLNLLHSWTYESYRSCRIRPGGQTFWTLCLDVLFDTHESKETVPEA